MQVGVLVLLGMLGDPMSSLATGELTPSGGRVFVAIDTLQLVASATVMVLLARGPSSGSAAACQPRGDFPPEAGFGTELPWLSYGAGRRDRIMTNSGTARRAGMPARNSVVAEEVLVPARRMAASSVAPSGGGTTYRVLRTNEVDPYDRPLSEAELPTFGLERFAGGDTFRGTAREAAKLSIADGAVETFDDLASLIGTLPSLEKMVDHQPPISTEKESARVDEEKRKIRVRAFLYAASIEKDNDFHLIVGLGRDVSPSMYMTMEISGLPPDSSENFTRLKSVRDMYKAFFGNNLPGASYDFYDPPIPVEIEGSLFFDMTHAHGPHPGPSSLRDHIPTIWEVHPISEIVFEP